MGWYFVVNDACGASLSLISCHLLNTSNQVICVMIQECLLGVYVYGLARLVQFSSHDTAYVTLI